MELCCIPDAFEGHLLFVDRIAPADPDFYLRRIRQRAIKHVKWDLWLSMDDDSFGLMRREAETIYFSRNESRVSEEVINIMSY